MGMPQAARFWTPDDVRALPADGHRYEVVAGELLVTPAPSLPHQAAAVRLHRLLEDYLVAVSVGYVAISPADIEPEVGALVQPDVFVAPLVGGRRPRSWRDIHSLLLAVEILSPSSARADRTVKRRLYQRAGVAEYWIVDLDARLVERWRPADDRPEVLAETLAWRPEGSTEPLTLNLPSFFAYVLDDPSDRR
jgi:Uma2 family endonuclease